MIEVEISLHDSESSHRFIIVNQDPFVFMRRIHPKASSHINVTQYSVFFPVSGSFFIFVTVFIQFELYLSGKISLFTVG